MVHKRTHAGGSRAACFALGLSTALVLGGPVGAVGSDTATPPPKTETTTECGEGTIWDDTQSLCVPINESNEDQAGLFNDARELAHAGRLDDATIALDRLLDTDDVLTYRAFIARQSGDWDAAETIYLAALERNPNNLLARSYYGQGLANIGDIEGASAQLKEIRKRGGRMTWPAVALRLTIDTADPAY